eukprot:973533_1
MTELGMALSNPLNDARMVGAVGSPLPGVRAKIDENGGLCIKSEGMFSEYWRKPDETRKAFDNEGWFVTGDAATQDKKDGTFRILGRQSVDILNPSGYKVSALDVEHVLLTHPDIFEVSVVGVENEEFGQTIGAIIILKENTEKLTIQSLRIWCSDRLARYKIPRLLKIVRVMPRNAMGKVNKLNLVKLFE